MIITTQKTVNCSQKQAFDYVLPVTLSSIFRRYKFFPAVIKTNETQTWNKAGLVRTVFFDDGTTAIEHLTTVQNFEYFDYVVTGFTSLLRFLIVEIHGSWKFETDGDNTEIIWKYELVAKNAVSEWVLQTILRKDIQTYLERTMDSISTKLNAK
jgi:hypothetical protein